MDREPDDLYDTEYNIEASAVLLKRLANRIENPTPEKIGTLWQSTAKDKTSFYGEYIRRVYDEKPWAKME